MAAPGAGACAGPAGGRTLRPRRWREHPPRVFPGDPWMMTGAESAWSRCNVCKKPIAFGALWYRCSVSTCNKKRLSLLFCSPDCWDAHIPDANHKNPLCIEERAPARG